MILISRKPGCDGLIKKQAQFLDNLEHFWAAVIDDIFPIKASSTLNIHIKGLFGSARMHGA